MRTHTLVLCLLLLSAGCLGEDATGPASDAPTDPSTDTGATALHEATDWYLDGSLAIKPQAPTTEQPDEVPVGSFYTAWAEGREQPTWIGPPLEGAVRVTNATLTFFYTAESAVATTGPQDQGFPEFVVYLGTETAPMGVASVSGPDVVQEGEVVEVAAELDLPKGGLVFATGDEPVVKIAPVQAQTDEGARILILVDGTSAPTRVTLDAEPVELEPAAATSMPSFTGTLAGSAYAGGAQEGASAASHPIHVPEDALQLRAQLERGTGVGIADIDLELLDASGEVVAQSVTPEDDEGLALYAPNLDTIGRGELTLRVVNYGNVVVQYQLTGSVWTPLS